MYLITSVYFLELLKPLFFLFLKLVPMGFPVVAAVADTFLSWLSEYFVDVSPKIDHVRNSSSKKVYNQFSCSAFFTWESLGYPTSFFCQDHCFTIVFALDYSQRAGVPGMPGSSSVLMENAAAATVAAYDSTPLLES